MSVFILVTYFRFKLKTYAAFVVVTKKFIQFFLSLMIIKENDMCVNVMVEWTIHVLVPIQI